MASTREMRDGRKKLSNQEIAELKPKDQLKHYLSQNEATLKNILPKHVTADRMMQVALTAFTTTPALANTYVPTVLSSIVQCSSLGLEPNTALGHAYLVPFKNNQKNRMDCQLIIGYRGLIDLARRSGEIVSINAHAVYEQDDFKYQYGLNEDLYHIPSEEDDPGELTHAYAIAHLKGGGHVFEVMTKKQIDKVRAGSQSGGSQYSPWAKHYEAMARKTVIRRLSKYLPMSIQMAQAVSIDEHAERGETPPEFNVFEGEYEVEGAEVEEEQVAPPPKKKAASKKKAAQKPEPEPEPKHEPEPEPEPELPTADADAEPPDDMELDSVAGLDDDDEEDFNIE